MQTRLTPACGAHHHAARDMSRVTFVLASHRVIVTARACSESSSPALCRSSGACKPRSKRETDAPALALACAPAPQTDASRDRAMKRVRKDWHGMQEPVSLRDWSCVNDGEGREACTNLVTCMHVTCIATIVHTNNSCTMGSAIIKGEKYFGGFGAGTHSAAYVSSWGIFGRLCVLTGDALTLAYL